MTGTCYYQTYFNQLTYLQAYLDYYLYPNQIVWDAQQYTAQYQRKNFDSSNNEIDMMDFTTAISYAVWWDETSSMTFFANNSTVNCSTGNLYDVVQ